MTVLILDQIHPSILRGIGEAHIGGTQIEVFDAVGTRLSGPPPATLPVVIEQPRILPATAALGQSVTLSLGAGVGTPAPVVEWDFTLDGASMRDRLDGGALTMELSLPGIYALNVGWRNEAGLVSAAEVTLTVLAPVVPSVDYDSQTLGYFDADTSFAGNAGDVTSITLRGTAGYVFSKTGSGATVRHVDNGFAFGDGCYLQSQNLINQPSTDGLFAVADVTLTAYGSNIGLILDGTGGHIKLRNNAGSLQVMGVDDSTVSLGLGTANYGGRMILAGQIDDIADALSGYDAAGNLLTTPHSGLTDPAPNRLSTGRYINGTVHRLAIIGRGEGKAWPITMREVVEDFRRGA